MPSARDRFLETFLRGQSEGGKAAREELDPLNKLLRQQQMKALEEERMDKKVQGIADRIEKSGIPQAAPALRGAEQSFKGKSVGPIMNMLPGQAQAVAANIKGSLGKLLGKPDWEGAGEEYQDLQRLQNIDIRQFAGAAQTKAETAKQMIEKGMSPGGSPEQVQRGMQMMRAALESHAKNIEAGSNPNALKKYSERAGSTPQGLLGKAPAAAAFEQGNAMAAPQEGPMSPDARRRRIQELRAKRGK